MKKLLYDSCTIIVLFLSFGTTVVFCQIGDPKGDDCQERRVQQIIRTLEPVSLLRRDLESGGRGALVREEWMDQMQSLSLRQATYKLSFRGTASNLKTGLMAATYLYGYYDYDATVSAKTIERIKQSGLEDRLLTDANEMVIQLATKEIARRRFESPKTARADTIYCGWFYATFLDDEVLPRLAPLGELSTECK